MSGRGDTHSNVGFQPIVSKTELFPVMDRENWRPEYINWERILRRSEAAGSSSNFWREIKGAIDSRSV
jgi:hypothetical protein